MGPAEEDIRKALQFARYHESSRLLVHCHAGLSRSAAVAYLILGDRYGSGHEGQALGQVFRIRPFACPNMRVIELGDQLLGRRGAVIAALSRRMEADTSLRALITIRDI